MCAVSFTLRLLYPCVKCPIEQEAGWARDLAWKRCGSEKSLDPART